MLRPSSRVRPGPRQTPPASQRRPRAASAIPETTVSSAPRSCQHQIVAVNHLITAAIAEQVGDFPALMTHDRLGIGGVIGAKTARHLVTGKIGDDHRIAALEL